MNSIRNKVGAAALMTVVALMSLASAASAQYVDPTNGTVDTAGTDVVDFITNEGLPTMLAVAVIGTVVAVAVKYVRKLRSAA